MEHHGLKTATIDGRHGRLTFFEDDEFVGRSLALYGEYSEEECVVFQKCLRPGQTVVEVGANIGAHTVPIAKIVGETGRVLAFEPCAEIAKLLSANLEQNHVLSWCHVLVMAAGDTQRRVYVPRLGELGHKNFGRIEIPNETASLNSTPMETIDSFDLDALHFLKIDAEGSELAIIRGARETIERHRPIIYCENDREEKSAALIAELIELRYRLYWHRPPLFSPLNARLNQKNVFGGIVSLMMVCVPEERGIEVVGMDEVADIRNDDDMFNREIERYMRYVKINPDDLNARGMAAHLCGMMRQNLHCEALIAENLRRDSKHVPTLIVQGMRTLQDGNWAEGWQAYELRYQQRKLRDFGGHRKHDVPKWNGEETDAPLLIWNEQGFGDTIMFARFVNWARMRAPNITLEVPPELFELFEQSGFTGLVRAGRKLPRYDLHCSIPSLPATLRADAAEMKMSGPYLHADTEMIAKWRERKHPKIGICHVGSPRSERPFTRDLPAEFIEGIGKTFGPFLSLVQDGQFESFADTAAAIASLDLVITVDTSVAHLAGAMGKPVWLLLSFDPDWRWGLKGSETIWYPSMRIFRQPRFRDWTSVIAEVEAHLAQMRVAA
jgi:FkbM family methyltransferase